MPTVADALAALERIAPASTAFSFDKVGLQVGEPSQEVRAAVVGLDCSEGLIGFAESKNAALAVAHHPVIWEPLAAVNSTTRSGRMVARLVQSGLAFVAAHTNWDCAPGGVNDALAGILGLQEVRPFGSSAEVPYLKLATFVPREDVNRLIEALSQAGAGVIGLYERCAFFSSGTGTYRGTEGANPTIGQAGRVEEVEEVRLEMRLPAERASQVERALHVVHRYEEPAYDLYPLRPERERSVGRIGELSEAVDLAAFAGWLDEVLITKCWAFGDASRKVKKVAVVGGAADGEWEAALAAGADVFVTGELRHHVAVEAPEAGLAVVAAGHFATENPGAKALCQALEREFPQVDWHFYEPPNGEAGRPA
jgi:dinuclear metal center YbgI/SA1388 family protein